MSLVPQADPRESVSPFHYFTATQWSALNGKTPLPISAVDLRRLEGLGDRISLRQAQDIYLPLLSLIRHHERSHRALSDRLSTFLHHHTPPIPYVIGLAGSVAAGKSTAGRLLKALLEAEPYRLRVALVATDGFLYPNAVLIERRLMERKGWPESYDLHQFMVFLKTLKSGYHRIQVPVYSHLAYDVLPDRMMNVEAADVVIVEGLNILQVSSTTNVEHPRVFASDFFDFSIYLDADADILRDWYIDRFMQLRSTAFQRPESYFHHYADLDPSTARATAEQIWRQINLPNLLKNILPTRERADLILSKTASHNIETVALRKI